MGNPSERPHDVLRQRRSGNRTETVDYIAPVRSTVRLVLGASLALILWSASLLAEAPYAEALREIEVLQRVYSGGSWTVRRTTTLGECLTFRTWQSNLARLWVNEGNSKDSQVRIVDRANSKEPFEVVQHLFDAASAYVTYTCPRPTRSYYSAAERKLMHGAKFDDVPDTEDPFSEKTAAMLSPRQWKHKALVVPPLRMESSDGALWIGDQKFDAESHPVLLRTWAHWTALTDLIPCLQVDGVSFPGVYRLRHHIGHMPIGEAREWLTSRYSEESLKVFGLTVQRGLAAFLAPLAITAVCAIGRLQMRPALRDVSIAEYAWFPLHPGAEALASHILLNALLPIIAIWMVWYSVWPQTVIAWVMSMGASAIATICVWELARDVSNLHSTMADRRSED